MMLQGPSRAPVRWISQLPARELTARFTECILRPHTGRENEDGGEGRGGGNAGCLLQSGAPTFWPHAQGTQGGIGTTLPGYIPPPGSISPHLLMSPAPAPLCQQSGHLAQKGSRTTSKPIKIRY